VLSCCKPGVDAARVSAGEEQDENCALNPKMEMSKLLQREPFVIFSHD
jgi:hypothetical protein